MKIALIIYVVTIIFYWIGALSLLTSVAKHVKEHPGNKYRATTSIFSGLVRIIIPSLIPILNIVIGAVWIFETNLVIKKFEEDEDV